MIRRQTLIALGIALVLGLLAVYLANTFLTRTEQRAAAAAQPMTRVAVAAVAMDYATEVTPEKVKFVQYPSASLPPGVFRNISELLPAGKSRIVLRPMIANEPILASKITGEGQGASIAALLPDGMRATSVRINDVSGVAGFIQPSDAVDVLITREVAGGESQVTDVLLQNIKVMAIGQDAKSKSGQPRLARSATLEVNPIDAQKLALAQQVGSLSLVLRKPGEEQNNPTVETVSMADLRYSLYGGARYARPPGYQPAAPRVSVATAQRRPVRRTVAAPAAPTPPTTSQVQVVRGTEGSNYEVGRYGS